MQKKGIAIQTLAAPTRLDCSYDITIHCCIVRNTTMYCKSLNVQRSYLKFCATVRLGSEKKGPCVFSIGHW